MGDLARLTVALTLIKKGICDLEDRIRVESASCTRLREEITAARGRTTAIRAELDKARQQTAERQAAQADVDALLSGLHHQHEASLTQRAALQVRKQAAACKLLCFRVALVCGIELGQEGASYTQELILLSSP